MITHIKKEYLTLVKSFIHENPLLDVLNGKTLLITGATGMIGSFLVDVIMHRNENLPTAQKVTVIALARDKEKAQKRFAAWKCHDKLSFQPCDIAEGMPLLSIHPDYYIHAASTTHPTAYANEPVNTILSNVLGINSILKYMATGQRQGRLLLLSSVEIYGVNRGDNEFFTEDYCGYIDCNTLRAGYSEAKRVSEALCQAYIRQYNTDAVIIRLPRIYGPTMQINDSKAASQFILNGVRGEDIVLKSEGTQFFSYAHVYDALGGMLHVLFKGEKGQAYNLGDAASDITLRDLARMIAALARTKVIFQLPGEVEKSGFSKATQALLNGDKLKSLGWKPRYDIKSGMIETISLLRTVF